MARLVFEENYEVYWGDTAPADPAAPTIAEVTAMTNVTSQIPKDGFAPGVSNNRVPAGDLSTAFDGELMGSWGSQLAVTAFLDKITANNVAFDSFGVRGATGCFLVIWDGNGNAAGSKTFCWPYVETGTPSLPTPAANERQTFTAECAVGGDGSEPEFHGEIVAA